MYNKAHTKRSQVAVRRGVIMHWALISKYGKSCNCFLGFPMVGCCVAIGGGGKRAFLWEGIRGGYCSSDFMGVEPGFVGVEVVLVGKSAFAQGIFLFFMGCIPIRLSFRVCSNFVFGDKISQFFA